MKSQKGDDHANAAPFLVHHSGKRDYRKYDKYLILINKNDIDGNSSNQQDTRGLIDASSFCNLNNSNNLNNQLSILANNLSNSLNTSLNNLKSPNSNAAAAVNNGNNDNLNLLGSLNGLDNLNSLSNLVNHLNENQNEALDAANKPADDEKFDFNNIDQDCNAESIVITPDINFSVGNETLDLNVGCQSSLINNHNNNHNINASSNFNSLTTTLNSLNNNLALNSILNSTNNSTTSSSSNGQKPSKLFYCAYCDYTHRDSKSLVSHLSIHAGKKTIQMSSMWFLV